MYVHLVYIVWYVAHMRKKKKKEQKRKKYICEWTVGSEFFLLKIKHKWIIKRFHLIEKSNKISIRTSAFTLEVPEIVYKYIPEYLAF